MQISPVTTCVTGKYVLYRDGKCGISGRHTGAEEPRGRVNDRQARDDSSINYRQKGKKPAAKKVLLP